MGNSSRVRVSMLGLENEVMNALRDTRILTGRALQTAIDKTARETVIRITGNAPVKSGGYRGGWSSKVTIQTGRGRYGRTVYNSPKYRLAHLLQHGHGGPRPARAYPHIPQDDETEALLEKNIESEMSRR